MNKSLRSRFSGRAILGLGLALGLAVTAAGTASADPNPNSPGTPPSGVAPADVYAGVGADAFAELTNFFADQYNGQNPTPTKVLASYDAINPVTGVAGETITTKPGCSNIVRPNGANAGLTLILHNDTSTTDTSSYCVDFVRASRAKKTDGTEAALTFYAQSADAVGYATVGNAYAPTAPLTTSQLKDIFECSTTDWSEVGGQAGPIHVYLPPASAATLTFFLTSIGTTLNNVTTGCGTGVFAQQQNDGRTLDGDPQGIAPYAVTKWAAQSNEAPGIADNRGGSRLGLVNTVTPPVTTTSFGGQTYEVLNPSFTADNPGYGRLFFNAVRTTAPAELKAIFSPSGYLCTHQNELLIPFGNTPLGSDQSPGSRYCGQTS